MIANPIAIEIRDEFDQVVSTDSTSVVSIQAASQDASLAGRTDITLSGGKAAYTDVSLITQPGTSDVEFEISSAFDWERLERAYGLSRE